MRKPPRVALLCAGRLTGSTITRLRGLHSRLGPIKSSSLRLASRFANMLGAGHPVRDFQPFRECHVLVVAVPENQVSSAVRDLSRADLDWSRTTVILCSARLESDELKPLAALGACTASICEASARAGRLFIAEGDPRAVTQLRPLVEHRDSKLVSLPAGHKKYWSAAIDLTGPLFASLLDCAGQCLKHAGFAASDAAGILKSEAERTIRNRSKSKGKSRAAPRSLEREIAALQLKDPKLAECFLNGARLAGWLPFA